MSSDMVSEQFPIPSSQGHLETVSGKSDASGQMGLMELGTYNASSQHMPVPNMQSEQMVSASSDPTSNARTGLLDPMPLNYVGLLDHMPLNYVSQSISSQLSSLIDSQASGPQLQPSLTRQYSSGGSVAGLNGLGSTQLAGKRKSPLESAPNGSTSEKLDMPNKRVAQLQHRPWLQQISLASNGPVLMPPASLSPKMQHAPMSTKKTMQLETVSIKSGKQFTNKKQSVPVQSSSKTRSDGNESVRSKMRESLAAALALVQQRDSSPKVQKSSQTEEASTSGTTQENSQCIEPVPAGGTDVMVAERTILALRPTGDESSVQKDSDGRTVLQETSNETKIKDIDQFDGRKSHFDEVFPRDDVSFSESIFANDELLQGNGLSWVLEPVTDFEETKDDESDEALKSDDGKVERSEVEKSFQNPELLASKIEMELFKLFGGVNKKYKEKGRSLLFNLKDKNNPELRERVVSGEILPERLCSMTAEELASKELSEWRQAKAEELAQMVVLRDTDIDVRRLVRKTHKGEFQVEIDPVDSGTVDVSAGVTSRTLPRAKNAKATGSSPPAKAAINKDESKEISKGGQEKSCTITIPSNEGTDPMQGLSVDDEMKDAEFLPPIVSLDEFMESLNSEPPFGSPPEDAAGKKELVSEKNVSEVGSVSKSPQQSPKEPNDSPKSKPEKINLISPKADASVMSGGKMGKSERTFSVAAVQGESVWDGLLQLNISSLVSVTGIFKSGEKTQTSEWPTLLEVKGRVRLNAFGKFLQELPLSRSRALMVIYLVCKDGVSKSQRGSLYEAAESYIADQRVGYAEPASGVELYLCPPCGETLDLLSKIVSKDQLEDVKSLDDGLIGVAVWRRAVLSPSASSRHKPSFKRQHSSSSRRPALPENKNSSVDVVNLAPNKPVVVSNNRGNDDVDDEDDDDVPPGFGPGAARDDDDLPEFNFSSSGGQVSSSRQPSLSRSVDQVRELIHKYGKSAGGNNPRIQPWNDNGDDDDDDDIPEWQPQAPGRQLPSSASLPPYSYQTHMVRPLQPPLQPNVVQQDGWWANQSRAGKHYGMPRDRARPRNRGF